MLPWYLVEYVDTRGGKNRSFVQASDRDAAVQILRDRGVYPINAREVDATQVPLTARVMTGGTMALLTLAILTCIIAGVIVLFR